MRHFLVFTLIVLGFSGPAAASDKSKQDAVTSAGMLPGTIRSCHLADPTLPDADTGVDEARQLLLAGGYSADEAAPVLDAILKGVAGMNDVSLTKDVCPDVLQMLRDGEGAAMKQLQSEV